MERPSGSSINSKQRLVTGTFIASSFLISALLFYLLPNLFGIWHYQISDQLFRLRYNLKGKEIIYPYIVHVDLNDSDIQQYKFSVWDRGLYAKIITVLTDAQMAAIAFDVFFPTVHENKDDQALVDATRTSGKVYYPAILIPKEHDFASRTPVLPPPDVHTLLNRSLWYPNVTDKGKPLEASHAILPFTDLSSTAKGIGNITCYPEKDGVFRRFPLIMKYGDGYFPSLGFRVTCDYLGVSSEDIEIHFGKQILLPNAHYPEGPDEITKDIVIPIDDQGKMIINFAGHWDDSFAHLSFGKLIEVSKDATFSDQLRDEMEGNIVIVSDTSTEGQDIGPSPFEINYPLGGLHSNIINTILTRNFLDELSLGQNILIWVVLVALLWLCAVRLNPFGFTCCSTFLFIIFLVLSCWFFMYQNIIINILCPSLGFLFSLVTVNTYRYVTEEREKAVIRSRFESYFAPPLLNKILKSPEKLQASERKVLTVLFSDIVGFTSWCSTQSPEKISKTLNEYFDEMTTIVFKHEGTIDKFMGDGLMVFFGDPLEQPDHAIRAVKAAIEMQQKTGELSTRWSKEGKFPIKIRIGINTGEVVVGNMGSEKHLDYTVIGSNVNLAQRLENSAPVNGILISESVYHKVKDVIQTQFYEKITAKGITEGISSYEIVVD